MAGVPVRSFVYSFVRAHRDFCRRRNSRRKLNSLAALVMMTVTARLDQPKEYFADALSSSRHTLAIPSRIARQLETASCRRQVVAKRRLIFRLGRNYSRFIPDAKRINVEIG